MAWGSTMFILLILDIQHIDLRKKTSWWVCKVWAYLNHHPHGLCFLRFGMLKAWMINPSVDSIHVEEKYTAWVQSLRTDRYVTVRTLFWFVKEDCQNLFLL